MLKVVMVTMFPKAPQEAYGGVEAACVHLAEGLSAYDDIDLHVVSPGPGGGATEHWTRPRCTIHRVRAAWPGLLAYWNVTRHRIQRKIQQIGPDVVHVQILAGHLGRRCPVPTILTTHGVEERTARLLRGPFARFRQWLLATVERRARPRYDYFVATSQYVVDELGDQIRGRIVHIYNAVAASAFELSRQEVPGRILYFGRVKATKNVHGLVEVARMLREAGVEFDMRIVGPAESAQYVEHLAGLIRRWNLQGRVHLAGQLSVEGVQRELAQAACMVLASFQESAPMTISEAMAAGVPVVSTRVGGVPYLVEDGRTGYVVESGDLAGFADRVRRVLESPALRQEFAARAVELARERFHPDVVARKTRQLYYEAAGRPVP